MEIPNAELNPVIQKTPEQIEQEMQQTRESMTAKVSALENQVVGTVQTAADTLTGTVDAVHSLMSAAPSAVSDTVQQAASAVGDKMKEIFDVSGHVQKNPWASVGVSAGVGFIAGLLLFRNQPTALPPASPSYAVPPTAAAAPAAPGIFNDLLAMLSQKVKKLAETAIESATAAANQKVEETIPKLIDNAAEATHLSSRFSGATQRV